MAKCEVCPSIAIFLEVTEIGDEPRVLEVFRNSIKDHLRYYHDINPNDAQPLFDWLDNNTPLEYDDDNRDHSNLDSAGDPQPHSVEAPLHAGVRGLFPEGSPRPRLPRLEDEPGEC